MTDGERIALTAILETRNRDANGFGRPPRGIPLRVLQQLRTGGFVELLEPISGGVEVKLTIAGLRAIADAPGIRR